MAVKIFILKNVPDDEAEDVRKLLTSNNIAYYETPERIWGISVPAIWLEDDGRLTEARALIDEYQARRASTEREKYRELQQRGEARGISDVIRERPVRFVAYCVAIGVILYFSIKPFLSL